MAEDDRHLTLPRGFQDTGPGRTELYRQLLQQWLDACALYGYRAVQVPPVGFASTFTAGHHAAGERFYRFPDRRGRDLALISDSLPALLRLARSQNHAEQRLSYCCPVFRYERKARRHFHHLGLMDVHDRQATAPNQIRSTLRIAGLVHEFLRSRLSSSFTITNPSLWHAIADLFLPTEKTTEYLNLLRHVPSLERPGQLKADGAPTAAVQLAELVAADPTLPVSPNSFLPSGLSQDVEESIAACHEMASALRLQGALAEIDLGELHASEFHDGPSFLLKVDEGRVLGDGGSYGRFARAFLSAPARVHAAVIGLERLTDLVAGEQVADPPAADLAILATPGAATQHHADRLATSLRQAGVSVWDTVLDKPTRQHLRDFAALAIPHSVIVGKRELPATGYMIRDRTGSLHPVARDDLSIWLIQRRG